MDPTLPRLEREERRRRRRLLFRNRRVPVRMLVPNFFTLLGLCAGLTSIRMAIDGRFELAIALVVAAGFLDAIDGRVARLLKAQSRFGAELDSLADFANFGIAPAFILYRWSLDDLKGLGWITALIFAIAIALRLARFNAALDTEGPKWRDAYFTGIPAPAAAIVVMLPLYMEALMPSMAAFPHAVAGYTVLIAFLTISTVPTFSGKLLGERISRELVLPLMAASVLGVALLVQYPYVTLAAATVGYLAIMPWSKRLFDRRSQLEAHHEGSANSDDGDDSGTDQAPSPGSAATAEPPAPDATSTARAEPKGAIVPLKGPKGPKNRDAPLDHRAIDRDHRR
ncbi:MAG: phosphatidylcholine/phosphatidylserine synthase [Pseudomonadota bacterium]